MEGDANRNGDGAERGMYEEDKDTRERSLSKGGGVERETCLNQRKKTGRGGTRGNMRRQGEETVRRGEDEG